MPNCYTNISSTYKEKEANKPKFVSSPDDVIRVIKEKAQKYNIDWKWLAAMAYVESNWVTNVRNGIGYCGLFQWHENRKDIAWILNKKTTEITNIFDVDMQTEASAKRMAANVRKASLLGLKGDDCYLYAGICHNTGEGGAELILSHCMPKTVRQMSQEIKTMPAIYIKWSWMQTHDKRNEISEYPLKMKKHYTWISEKYS